MSLQIHESAKFNINLSLQINEGSQVKVNKFMTEPINVMHIYRFIMGLILMPSSYVPQLSGL